jgi:hypothetical protein
MELNPETMKQAKEDIELICAKYQIALVPVVVHQGDRTFSSIEIVPIRKQQQSEEQ